MLYVLLWRSNCREAYIGDFSGLLESIRKLNHKLSETLGEIKNAVSQVSAGAGQMADAAQGLAEGATDQAGSCIGCGGCKLLCFGIEVAGTFQVRAL